jgi:sugar (pentulose or hexulose) kinase
MQKPPLAIGLDASTQSVKALALGPDGIEAIAANSEVTATVYNATGQQLFTLTTTKARAAADVRRLARTSGTYIVKLKAGQQSGTLKVLVR